MNKIEHISQPCNLHSTPVNKSPMVKVWFWRLKNQKDSLCWHRNEINDIYDAYYHTTEVPSSEIIMGESIETEIKIKRVFSYRTDSVMKRFKIRCLQELMFLLAQHPENQKTRCEYCEEGFVFKNKSGTTITCGHTGYCRFEACVEPVRIYSYCDKHDHIR